MARLSQFKNKSQFRKTHSGKDEPPLQELIERRQEPQEPGSQDQLLPQQGQEL